MGVTLACLASAAFGLCWPRVAQPYSARAPKKVYLFHVLQLGPDQSAVQRASWDALLLDSTPVQAALPAALLRLPQRPLSRDEMLVLHPASSFMQVPPTALQRPSAGCHSAGSFSLASLLCKNFCTCRESAWSYHVHIRIRGCCRGCGW